MVSVGSSIMGDDNKANTEAFNDGKILAEVSNINRNVGRLEAAINRALEKMEGHGTAIAVIESDIETLKDWQKEKTPVIEAVKEKQLKMWFMLTGSGTIGAGGGASLLFVALKFFGMLKGGQ